MSQEGYIWRKIYWIVKLVGLRKKSKRPDKQYGTNLSPIKNKIVKTSRWGPEGKWKKKDADRFLDFKNQITAQENTTKTNYLWSWGWKIKIKLS